MQIDKPLVYYIPDTRGVVQSRYGLGNLKIGPNVHSYSRLPGRPSKTALGMMASEPVTYQEPTDTQAYLYDKTRHLWPGTCPGSTPECESICYAARPVEERGPVASMWQKNTITDDVPPIPEEAKLLRLHVSGDFDSVTYISNWITRLSDRPDVRCWVYTRSWRAPELLPHLENLRALPNVQMFASMDQSTPELPPTGWRRAWIDGDKRAGQVIGIAAHNAIADHNIRTVDGTMSLICPEETGRQPNCETCGYCQDGKSKDVTFLRH